MKSVLGGAGTYGRSIDPLLCSSLAQSSLPQHLKNKPHFRFHTSLAILGARLFFSTKTKLIGWTFRTGPDLPSSTRDAINAWGLNLHIREEEGEHVTRSLVRYQSADLARKCSLERFKSLELTKNLSENTRIHHASLTDQSRSSPKYTIINFHFSPYLSSSRSTFRICSSTEGPSPIVRDSRQALHHLGAVAVVLCC